MYQETAQGARKVNHLFKADFFGERALLTDEPRCCSASPACAGCYHAQSAQPVRMHSMAARRVTGLASCIFRGRSTLCAHVRSRRVRRLAWERTPLGTAAANANSSCFDLGRSIVCKLQFPPHCPLRTVATRAHHPRTACRGASVQADSALVAFTISRERFREVLGTSEQLEKIMATEKSPAVVTTRLMRLQARAVRQLGMLRMLECSAAALPQGPCAAPGVLPCRPVLRHSTCTCCARAPGGGAPPHACVLQAKGMPPHMPATVLLKRRRKGKTPSDWEVVRARGHLDEVQALRVSSPAGVPLLLAPVCAWPPPAAAQPSDHRRRPPGRVLQTSRGRTGTRWCSRRAPCWAAAPSAASPSSRVRPRRLQAMPFT